jgi:hypothetical protein
MYKELQESQEKINSFQVKNATDPGSATLDFVIYFWHMSQVSWTKEVKKARKGESSVSLYDAEGYSALKRSRERGEADSLAPLLTIVVSYPGSYSKIVFILYVFEYSMDFLCFAHCDFSGSFVFKNGSDT